MAKITKIEQTTPTIAARKRVAAYARVSMQSERMLHSLSAQISYYSGLIQKNPEWEYVGVYADDFISGTDTVKRDEFNRMLQDCEDGKIDATTIFGNLLDNAMEGTKKAEREKHIFIKLASYHQMVVARIENSCGDVKWKNGLPISEKGEGRGIGLLNVRGSIEKYDGDLQLRQEQNRFVVELFLNS